MAPASRQPSLKQSKLSFASFKRTTSTASSQSQGAKPAATPPVLALRRDVPSSPEIISSDSESDREEDDDISSYSGSLKRHASASSSSLADEGDVPEVEEPPAKKRRSERAQVQAKIKPSPAQVRSDEAAAAAAARASGVLAVRNAGEGVESEVLDLKDKRWNKHYRQLRAKTGDVRPIHSEGLTQVHHILRVFDLSYEYGPCVGLSRLQRWERANAMGLKPPAEVREILMTKAGREKDEFSQTVFHGEV